MVNSRWNQNDRGFGHLMFRQNHIDHRCSRSYKSYHVYSIIYIIYVYIYIICKYIYIFINITIHTYIYIYTVYRLSLSSIVSDKLPMRVQSPNGPSSVGLTCKGYSLPVRPLGQKVAVMVRKRLLPGPSGAAEVGE